VFATFESETDYFGSRAQPEGNRVELWQPPDRVFTQAVTCWSPTRLPGVTALVTPRHRRA